MILKRSLQSRAIQAFTEGAQTPAAVVCTGGGSIRFHFSKFWFLALRDFRELHLVCANQSGRRGLSVCSALSFACAIFLILELDNPFTG